MADIVERLRRADTKSMIDVIADDPDILIDAADEIERLRSELERWRIADKQAGMETLGTMDGFHNGPNR